MSQSYLALTIGPIYKTLQSVKSTKAIWGASYLFSYTMKHLMEAIKKEDGNADFLMPYADWNNGKIESKVSRVGLLPDRTIFSSSLSKTALKKVFTDYIVALSIQVSQDLTNTKKYQEHNQKFVERASREYTDAASIQNKVAHFLNRYLQLYSLQVEIQEAKPNDTNIKKDNPIQIINDLLDSLDLQASFNLQKDVPILTDFFENIYYNFLVGDEFFKNKNPDDPNFFPMAVQIAAGEYRNADDDTFKKFSKLLEGASRQKPEPGKKKRDEQKEFLDKFKKDVKLRKDDPNKAFPDISFKQRHKYITTVLADGDNIGFFIGKVFEAISPQGNANQLFKAFSQHLAAFTQASVLLIRRFGGVCVYAGGDDLLFFAPVYVRSVNEAIEPIEIPLLSTSEALKRDVESILKEYPNGASIFWLTDKLEVLFNLLIRDNPFFQEVIKICFDKYGNEKKPSLSFGVNISYYKHPLNEALAHAKHLLFEEAKNISGKNTLAFHVLKHSGQYYGTTYAKSSDAYKKFNYLLTTSYEDEALLSSIAHKIDEHKMVLLDIAKDNPAMPERLRHFFKNNFDEDIKKPESQKSPKDKYLQAVRELLEKILPDNVPSATTDTSNHLDKPLEQLYASLRFAHFLKTKDKDE